MQIISVTEFYKKSKRYMDMSQDWHEPIIITRKQGNMVMLSLEDYNALQETAYLLNNPKNAQHILTSLAEIRTGRGQARKLIDVE